MDVYRNDKGLTMYGNSQYGSAMYGEMFRVIEAIKEAEVLSKNAQKELINFVKETYNERWERAQDLLDIAPPEDLIEYWDLFIQVIEILVK